MNRAGGVAYLASLIDGMPSIENVEHWAHIVKDRSVTRGLRMAAAQITNICDAASTADEAVSEAFAAVMKVADKAEGSDGFATPAQAVKKAMAHIDLIIESKGVVGLRTGFDRVDVETGGLLPSQLMVIAGRPGMGKTAAAVSIADEVAQEGKKVAFFSLEMSTEELTLRRVQRRSRVPLGFLRFASEEKRNQLLPKILKAAGPLAEEPFFVDSTPALKTAQVRARARRLAAEKGGLDLIIIDYLQLIVGERGEGRQQEVAGIARALKNLSKELQVPVIALSQLNREVENREDKRPRLADLRESGEVEQSADIVMFLYRHEVYHPEQEDTKGIAEWIVAKHRNGQLFTERMAYEKELASFSELQGV
jgi:replicative DNA helicase